MNEKSQEEIKAYINHLPDERLLAFKKLRQVLLDYCPRGFEETFAYGMISYVVPHRIYPKGYHVNQAEPLPFISIGNQKNHIAMYHYGLYADDALMKWFKEAYQNQSPHKLDIGKSCIRFKYMDEIPYSLIKVLLSKISVEKWIKLYEKGRDF